MESEVTKLVQKQCGEIDVNIYRNDGRIRLSMGVDVYDSTPEDFPADTKPEDLFNLVARALEENGEVERWRLSINALDPSLAEAIAAVAFDPERKTPLIGLSVTGDVDDYQFTAIARLIEPPSSIHELYVEFRSLQRIMADTSNPNLDKLTVACRGRAAVIGEFVRRAGITRLCLEDWPSGAPLQELSGLESFELHTLMHPADINLQFLAACPRLTHLVLDEEWRDRYLAVLDHVAKLDRLEELTIPADDEKVLELVRCLSSLPNLRSLNTWHLSPEGMELIAWTAPRLQMVIDDVEDEDYGYAIKDRNGWLVSAAMTVPLGDLSRELAAYL
jgi:hypothetical protein